MDPSSQLLFWSEVHADLLRAFSLTILEFVPTDLSFVCLSLTTLEVSLLENYCSSCMQLWPLPAADEALVRPSQFISWYLEGEPLPKGKMRGTIKGVRQERCTKPLLPIHFLQVVFSVLCSPHQSI